jgi:hypothetical protein
MSNKQMDRIDRAVNEIAGALKTGQFTRAELESIIALCGAISGVTQKILDRASASSEQPND